MTHEDAIDRLPEYLRGDLDGELAESMSAHVASCEECREMQATYRLLEQTLQARERLDEHPSSAEIAAVAVDPAFHDDVDVRRVEDHAARCASCREEIELVREAERIARDTRRLPGTGRWFSRPTSVALMAASLLVALLAYPAFVGLVRFPETARKLQSLQAGEGWGAAMKLPTLSSMQRGTGDVLELVVTEDQPVVPLALAPFLAMGLEDDARLRISVETEEGPEVWTAAMDWKEMKASFADSGVVILLIPASVLGAGDYVLSVRSDPATDDGSLQQYRFRVVCD